MRSGKGDIASVSSIHDSRSVSSAGKAEKRSGRPGTVSFNRLLNAR